VRIEAQWICITSPATSEAKAWEGWGTALKPAFEPVVVGRKPLVGTVAENVLEWGVGGLNIDGSRIAGGERPMILSKNENSANAFGDGLNGSKNGGTFTQGRWPANVIHDGSDEVTEKFPETAFSSGGGMKRSGSGNNIYGKQQGHPQVESVGFMDSGSAARFFKECSNEG